MTCVASPPFTCLITPLLSYLVAAWLYCQPWSTYDLMTTPGSATARPCRFGIGCGGSEAPPPRWCVFHHQSWRRRTWKRWRKRSCPVACQARVMHVVPQVGRWSMESLWTTWIVTETITTTISGRTCPTGTSTACLHPRPCRGHLREAAETVPAGAARQKGGSMRCRYYGRGVRKTILQMTVNMTCLQLQGGRTSASPELLLAHQVGSRELIIKLDHMLQIIFSVYHQHCCCHSFPWSYAETGNGHFCAGDATLWFILLNHPALALQMRHVCITVCVHDCV